MSAVNDAGNYIRQHENIVAPLYKDYSLKFWDLSLNGNNKSLEEALITAKERYLKVYNNRDEFRRVREWKAANLSFDEIAARQLKLIHDTFVPNQIEEDVLRDIGQGETPHETRLNTFRSDFEGGKASDNQLRDILRTERNMARRRDAWEATKQVGHETAPKVL